MTTAPEAQTVAGSKVQLSMKRRIADIIVRARYRRDLGDVEATACVS
jgi:hypothetical protein